MNNCEWKSIEEHPIPKGAHVFLRMSNRGNISYAIGATDVETGKLWYPAREEKEGEPVFWMPIPD
jgi:hypothetical protein